MTDNNLSSPRKRGPSCIKEKTLVSRLRGLEQVAQCERFLQRLGDDMSA